LNILLDFLIAKDTADIEAEAKWPDHRIR
jgi:hypothetical protein